MVVKGLHSTTWDSFFPLPVLTRLWQPFENQQDEGKSDSFGDRSCRWENMKQKEVYQYFFFVFLQEMCGLVLLLGMGDRCVLLHLENTFIRPRVLPSLLGVHPLLTNPAEDGRHETC